VHGITSSLTGQQLDQSDPVAVANAFLQALQNGNYTTIVSLMLAEQQQEYQAILQSNPQDMANLFQKDKQKAGKKTRITELRKMKTLSGKDGVAAKVKKEGEDIYVVILAKVDNKYYYENSLTLGEKLYKSLTFIRKVKY
jgi:hypothetical protein